MRGLEGGARGILTGNVGRWLSRDPLGEGSGAAANLYAYVMGNPISHTHPSGLICVICSLMPPPQSPRSPSSSAVAPRRGHAVRRCSSPSTRGFSPPLTGVTGLPWLTDRPRRQLLVPSLNAAARPHHHCPVRRRGIKVAQRQYDVRGNLSDIENRDMTEFGSAFSAMARLRYFRNRSLWVTKQIFRAATVSANDYRPTIRFPSLRKSPVGEIWR